MFFARVKTPGLAHVAYLIGGDGEVAIVDPRRDVDEYLALAQKNDLAVTHVVETHRQEDFVVGAAEIARRTGAKIVCGDHARFGHGDVRLRDGDTVRVGGVTLRALHTPGHTPESTSYAVSVDDAPDRTLGVFTGDTLFVSETGRVDLVEPERVETNAGMLWDAVHEKLLPLGDQTLIWPAHGKGSVCGGAIADRDESTLGIERATNAVFTKTRDAFVAQKKKERIPRPPYFVNVERVNGEGGLPPGKSPLAVRVLSPDRFEAESKRGLVIDTREPEAFAGGHLPQTLNVWLEGLAIFGGYYAGPATRIWLVQDDESHLAEATALLARLGIDGVEGVLAGGFSSWRNAGKPIAFGAAIDPRAVSHDLDRTTVLDVRDDEEFAEGHIPGALHVYVGHLDERIDHVRADLERKPSLVVTCSVGHRAGIATSILERAAVAGAKNMLGGMTAWKKLGLPMET